MSPRGIGLFMSFTGTCLGVGFIVKDYVGGKKYTYKTDAAKNKLFLITGATSGLGKATAKELAFRKGKVILACRDMPKCEVLARQIRYASKNKAVECRELDLSSQESIRTFVNGFNEKYKKLDVLINNAGVMAPPRQTTDEGIELQLGVNHMGHFLLTHLLLPKLKAAVPSRIINVTSLNYKNTTINKEDLNSVKSYDAMAAYRQSKTANVLFTLELAERLQGTGITVNAVYPGVTNSKLMRHSSYYKSYFSSLFLKPLVWMFIKNTKQGSQPIVYAAIDPDMEDVTGHLISNKILLQVRISSSKPTTSECRLQSVRRSPFPEPKNPILLLPLQPTLIYFKRILPATTNFIKEKLQPCPQEDEDMPKWLWDVSLKWTKLLNST